MRAQDRKHAPQSRRGQAFERMLATLFTVHTWNVASMTRGKNQQASDSSIHGRSQSKGQWEKRTFANHLLDLKVLAFLRRGHARSQPADFSQSNSVTQQASKILHTESWMRPLGHKSNQIQTPYLYTVLVSTHTQKYTLKLHMPPEPISYTGKEVAWTVQLDLKLAYLVLLPSELQDNIQKNSLRCITSNDMTESTRNPCWHLQVVRNSVHPQRFFRLSVAEVESGTFDVWFILETAQTHCAQTVSKGFCKNQRVNWSEFPVFLPFLIMVFSFPKVGPKIGSK